MKKISPRERRGALILGVVALLIVAAAFWLRSRPAAPAPEVTVIVPSTDIQSDSTIENSESSVKGPHKKTKAKRTDKKDLKNKRKKNAESPDRDILSEGVPVKSNE